MTTLVGDGPCAECGTDKNIVWHTESVFWNNVVRRKDNGHDGYAMNRWGSGDAILCIPCFIRIAEERGYRPTGWRLTPQWPIRRVEGSMTRATTAGPSIVTGGGA